MRFGILPQVLPIMLSNALYMFESNTRSATILGIVGAGGIGFALSDRIRAHRWEEVGFIIIMIIVVVAADRLPLAPAAQPAHQGRRQSPAAGDRAARNRAAAGMTSG